MAVPTRCSSIDAAIGGGFMLGHLSEVCGESGAGKTQLCLQTVATAKANADVGGLGGSMIYITFMNPFPTRRLQQMLALFPPSSQQNENLVERVTKMTGSTPYDLLGLVNEVDVILKADDAPQRNFKVVVLDTIYGFVTHHFPDTQDGVNKRAQIICSVGFALKKIVGKYNAAVIACNHAVDLYGMHLNGFLTSGRLVKPGVGLQWDRYLYVRYVLAREAAPGTGTWARTFQILDKGQYYARCRFAISDRGVCSA